jgi:murein DD-endopeptidase MepM/ murein hydrolase activator NlpD
MKFVSKVAVESPAHKVWTHKTFTADLTNSIDFICDEGTPVCAARSGKVCDLNAGVTKNWNKFETPPESSLTLKEQNGNFVVIEHDNGEYTIYCHLKPNSISVKKNSEVKEGQFLGYSGNTGWSIVPHLHFVVYKRKYHDNSKKTYDIESLEIRWKK